MRGPSIVPSRASLARPLPISTTVPHQTATDARFSNCREYALAGSPEKTGTRALVSQNASVFFTFFPQGSQKSAGGNLGARQGEDLL